ncbi:hypothetical protein JCM9803A_03060 [Rhodococcus erythropolis]
MQKPPLTESIDRPPEMRTCGLKVAAEQREIADRVVEVRPYQRIRRVAGKDETRFDQIRRCRKVALQNSTEGTCMDRFGLFNCRRSFQNVGKPAEPATSFRYATL